MTSKVKTGDPHEKVRELIARLSLRHSYWGYLFSRVIRIADESMPSIMGVCAEKEGQLSLRYHPEMVSKTSDEVIDTILVHEGMHILNKHVSRLLRVMMVTQDQNKKAAKAQLWNIAADCVVNTQAKLPEVIEVAGSPWKLMHPKKFGLKDGETCENYYIQLLEKAKKNKKMKGPDNHDGWTKNAGKISDLSALHRKIEQHTQGIIRKSAREFAKDRGRLPGGVAELIEAALEPPKVPYYQMIQKLVKGSRLSKLKRSPTRINRKRAYTFVINKFDDEEAMPEISPFPGRVRDTTFNICVVIDTSGSMSPDDMREGLSGIKNIIERDCYCKTTVIEIDTKIQKEYSPKRLHDIDFKVKGRGGTVLLPGLERARELACDVCLVFSDGECERINDVSRGLLPKKLIWVITEGGTASNVNKTGYVIKV